MGDFIYVVPKDVFVIPLDFRAESLLEEKDFV